MKISKREYEIPDNCPEDCLYKNNMINFGQSSICIRCPVFNCKKDVDGFCLLEPEEYRDDWAKEWYEFFKTGKEPTLYLTIKETEN